MTTRDLEPTFSDVLRARRLVRAHLPRTPLHRHPGLETLLGAPTWVKHENHHAVGAFKVRGGVTLAAGLGRRSGVPASTPPPPGIMGSPSPSPDRRVARR